MQRFHFAGQSSISHRFTVLPSSLFDRQEKVPFLFPSLCPGHMYSTTTLELQPELGDSNWASTRSIRIRLADSNCQIYLTTLCQLIGKAAIGTFVLLFWRILNFWIALDWKVGFRAGTRIEEFELSLNPIHSNCVFLNGLNSNFQFGLNTFDNAVSAD